jgi:hypothetical protein
MRGRGFILFKAGRAGPKSAEQAEIRLANLLKILAIWRPEEPGPGRGAAKVTPRSRQGRAKAGNDLRRL